MNLAIFGSRLLPSCLCVLVCMLGCGESKESLHEMDHVVPAHWPSDLTDAASKLRERLNESPGKLLRNQRTIRLKHLRN